MVKWIKLQLACFTFLFSLSAHADNANLTAIRFVAADSATRMIVTLSQPAKYHVFTLANPNRLVIDFEQTRLTASLRHVDLSTAAIKSIRSGWPKPDTLRIVVDTEGVAHFKILSPSEDSRLVLDIGSGGAVLKKETALPPQPAAAVVPTPVAIAAPLPHAIVVVIDAGHGGKDPGAIGAAGTKEKNVTLAVARQLAEIINSQPNMRAVLTRKGDYFVALRDRLKLARKGNADVFVAIHADSYFNNQAGGASVYALSAHGATSEAARWLAKRDNYSELGGVNLRGLDDQSYLLRSVLIDLAQTATITDSLRLGNSLLMQLDDVTKLHYTRVEQAPFMVLKSPDIPSVLVELGFISNANEEMRLQDSDYQNKMARALFEGIRVYLKKYSTLSS